MSATAAGAENNHNHSDHNDLRDRVRGVISANVEAAYRVILGSALAKKAGAKEPVTRCPFHDDTAGSLCSTDIAPCHCSYGPLRHPCILSDEYQTRVKLGRGRPCYPESIETVAERGRHAPKHQARARTYMDPASAQDRRLFYDGRSEFAHIYPAFLRAIVVAHGPDGIRALSPHQSHDLVGRFGLQVWKVPVLTASPSSV